MRVKALQRNKPQILNWAQVMAKLLKITGLLVVLFLYTSCSRQGEDSIRLIPEGFEGPVMIIYNQSDGASIEYEGDKRLYRIPSDGVLRTQFKPNYGHQIHEFYYINREGKRTPIPFVDPWSWSKLDASEGVLICFAEEVGMGGDKQGKEIRFRIFLVGPANKADSLFKLKEKFVLRVLNK